MTHHGRRHLRFSRQNAQEPHRRGSLQRSRSSLQVAILPIFWNQRQGEKKAIMKVCERAAELLDEACISSHVDRSNEHTPGKRMRHWCVPCTAAAHRQRPCHA